MEYLGHAALEYAVALRQEAGVGRVVLFHHAPDRTDHEIDTIAAATHGGTVLVIAAYAGLEIDLPEDRAVRTADHG
ncbi:MAG: hypothetical protein M3R66_06470 [Actinomycetota bacterium]|nr:hypothetical protein [Actinomycetota bacterium]